jgi:formylglycine-generating enzyme required for sulfatase activity
VPSKVFISYRRDDDPAAAARVRDGLAPSFGKANLFMDVDNLLAGQRFDQELAKALAVCDVLIAVIGSRWMQLLKSKSDGGERDYVREEIAAALRRQIMVIPVRVGREGQLLPLPGSEDLPADIRDLLLYQKHDVTHEHFGRDIAELIEAITVVRRSQRSERAVRQIAWGWIGAAAASVLLIAYIGGHYAGLPVPWPQTQAEREAELTPMLNRTDAPTQAKRENDARQKTADEARAKVDPEAERRRLAMLQQEEARKAADAEAARKRAETSVPQPGKSFRDCPDCPEMVVVPAGEFTIGSPASEKERSYDEGPQRKVTIRQPFAVGKFEVTFAEWDACVAGGGCKHKPSDQGWGRGKRPVISVSWDDTKEYTAWLSNKTGKTYRLLTEAEWEYAARAGSSTPFSTGPTIAASQANFNGDYTYNGSAKGQYRGRPTDVGSFTVNTFGLHDMHGNAWEWVQDCYKNSYDGAPTDGRSVPDTSGCRRVLRGGSWGSQPQSLRAATRDNNPPDYRMIFNGFRLARTLIP